MRTINLTLNLTATILSAMLLIASLLGGNPREKVFRWFFALVLITLVGAPGDFLISLLMGTPGRTVYTVIRVVDGINYMSMGITLIFAGMYFYELLSTRTRISRAYVTLHIFLAVAVTVLVAVAQFTPILVRLDENNLYHKERLFWLFELFPTVSIVAGMTIILRHRRLFKPREWVSLLFYTIIPILCYVIETLVEGIWLTYLGSAIALLIIYINIQTDLRQRLTEQDAELAEGRMAIMRSQIQPHFLFNTLSSISAVCEDNPLAQQSLITFSEYLRVNMDALTERAPIPFSQELAHIRQYLWLEQLRFEEKLAVAYDIREEDFRLPVLTLQPIVENAVRHGITRKATPGTVRILTERTRQGVRIVVQDDGVGFDPGTAMADGRSHTGLDNVRARLAALCGGWLVIHSVPGGGTSVTIEIPDQRRDTQ